MQVIGFNKTAFKPKDSDSEIRGYNLYLTEEREKVTGLACDRLFVSEYKLDGYEPTVGDNVVVVWNRWGKVDAVKLV